MTRRIALLAAAPLLWAQQGDAPVEPKPGSVEVTVLSQSTGAPVRNATVTFTVTSGRSRYANRLETDPAGHVALEDARPGKYTLVVMASPGSASVARAGELAPEQHLSLEVRVPTDAQLSGRVLDGNGDPLPNIAVFLVAREYSLGSLRYTYAQMAATDDRGEYQMEHVRPGSSYLLLAATSRARLEPVSRAPADPALRRPVNAPTYYPGAPAIEGAQVLTLADNERRPNVDIRMARSANYCLEARVPAGATFELREEWPLDTYLLLNGRSRSGAAVPLGTAPADGRIRVCDLHPGGYELSAYLEPSLGDVPTSFSKTIASIADQDVGGVTLIPSPQIAVAGEIVWAGPAEAPPRARISLTFDPLSRHLGGQQVAFDVPGSFRQDLLLDDYSVDFGRPPAGSYVKDVTYGGRSVLHEPLRPGGAPGEGLRVILATDGGTVAVKIEDRNGDPVPDQRVLLLPKSVTSEAALADAMETAQADSNGAWTSAELAPGSYYVLATPSAVDNSPETIARIWRARDRATEVTLAPESAPQVTVTPIALQ